MIKKGHAGVSSGTCWDKASFALILPVSGSRRRAAGPVMETGRLASARCDATHVRERLAWSGMDVRSGRWGSRDGLKEKVKVRMESAKWVGQGGRRRGKDVGRKDQWSRRRSQ